jgi:hypothetical protein
MPPLLPAADGEDATAAGLRNVAAGVTLADAVVGLRALDAATPAGACAARAACATLALALRPAGSQCAAVACVRCCDPDAVKQVAASALGAEMLLQRTLVAGAHDAGLMVYGAWALAALCSGGHAATLDADTACVCVGTLTGALDVRGRIPVVALSVATALKTLFSSAAAVRFAVQCETAAALFECLDAAARCPPPPPEAQSPPEEQAALMTQWHAMLERLGDALIALLDATDGASVRAIADGCAVSLDTTLAALHVTLHRPHLAARFAGVLALLCAQSAGARRAALACRRGDGTVAAVCTLLGRAAELHLPAPLHALSALLQNGDAAHVAPLARARGAQAAVLAALRAHPDDEQLASSALMCLYHLILDDDHAVQVACARAARDAGGISLIVAALAAHAPTLDRDWPLMCTGALCAVTEGADEDVSASDALAVTHVALGVLRTHAHADMSLANASILLRNTWRDPGDGGAGSAQQKRELARVRAGAIAPLTAALARHAASLRAATTALRALTLLMDSTPALEDAALAAGAAPAAVAAMRAHATDGALQQRACNLLGGLVFREDVSALVAAGTPAAIVAAMATRSVNRGAHAAAAAAAGALEAAARLLRLRAHADVHVSALQLLCALLAGCAGNAALAVTRIPDVRALLADVARVVAELTPEQRDTRRASAALTAALTAALEAHDGAAAACDAGAACVRCAEQRREGARCGLAACGARRRHEQPAKGLLRCASCRTAAYCCGEHQREAWAAHKPACLVARAAATAAAQ